MPYQLAGKDTSHPVVITAFVLTGVRASATNFTLFSRNIGGSATISSVRLLIGTSSGNIAVAAYDDTGTGGSPGSRLGTSGSVACPAAGTADVALGASTAVDYNDWLAVGSDNNTVTFGESRNNFGTVTSLMGALCLAQGSYPPPATAAASDTNRHFVLRGV